MKDADQSAKASLGQGDYVEARRREAIARAFRIEQITAREAGKLVPREEVERVMGIQIAAARARFIGVASRLRSDFPDLDDRVFARISELVREALQELADQDEDDALDG